MISPFGIADVERLCPNVSEGKNDAIYTFHTYHTKAPNKAIMTILNPVI